MKKINLLKLKNKRILILTSSTGGGHDSRAKTFRKWFEELYPNELNIKIENIIENSSLLGQIGVLLYNTIQKNFPFLHKIFWWIVELYGYLESKFLIKYNRYYYSMIKKFKPNLILSVHDCTNRGYFQIAKKILGITNVICGTYCGEFSGGYGFSHMWVEPSSDFYYCRTIDSLKFSRKIGLPDNKGNVCFNIFPPSYFKKKLTLLKKRNFLIKEGLNPNKFTIYLASGMVGSNQHLLLLNKLLLLKDKIQVIAVCGLNKNATLALKKWKLNHPDFSILIEGYSRRIASILQVSNLLITRGGSNSNAEALYWGCPPLFYNFKGIMPQEELTVKYFINNKCGIEANSINLIYKLIQKYVLDFNAYESLIRNCFNNKPTDSIKDIIHELIYYIKS